MLDTSAVNKKTCLYLNCEEGKHARACRVKEEMDEERTRKGEEDDGTVMKESKLVLAGWRRTWTKRGQERARNMMKKGKTKAMSSEEDARNGERKLRG